MQRLQVPILTYHSLDDSGSVISIRPADFCRHVEHLHRRGFQAVSLRTLIQGWRGQSELPKRPVVLTFDDGFRNVLDCAVPVLQRFGFSATLFVVAGYCGRINDWPSQPRNVPQLPLLSFSELRELSGLGLEIGAHGMTHVPLVSLREAALQREVRDAQRRIEDNLGEPVTSFAYPYGRHDEASRRMVAAELKAACGTRLGHAHSDDDRYALPRVETYYFRHPALFRLFALQRSGTYLQLRKLGRACRTLLRPSKLAASQEQE